MPSKFKLKNNLSVLLIESHKSPVVSTQMWVRTGSADEKKGQEGISHFIEHLVFKGTDKFDVGEIASTVEMSGGELNAFTSFDQTVFYVTISKEFADVSLDVISQMMGHPKFDSDEIDNEREVVIEEIKRSNDSLHRQASRLLFETNFKEHPYGLPVIGYDRIIKKVPRKQIKNYYESRYVPSNMQLVIAGDFDAKEMKKKVKEYFGSMEDYKLKKIKRTKEPKQDKARIKVKKTNFAESVLHLSWKAPGVLHDDIPALDVLALIFGQGESSRLVQKLRVQKPIANSIGCGTFTPKDYGLLDISSSFNYENIDELLDGILSEMELFLAEPPTEEEMAKAIRIFESEEIYSVETVDGIARKAGMLEDLTGDYKFFKKYLDRVTKLTASEVLRVARKYFNPDKMSLVMVTPNDEKEARKKLRAWAKKFEKVHAKYKRKKITQTKKIKMNKLKVGFNSTQSEDVSLEKRTLDCGLPVVFRKTTDSPLVSVKTAFLGGMRIEDKDKLGITEVMARSWTGGTSQFSEKEIQNKIEKIAGSISAFGGRNTAGLTIQCLSPFQDEAIDLFSSILSEPQFSESILEREKHLISEQVRSRSDSPAYLCSLNFLKEIFNKHPYSRDPLGTPESLGSIQSDDVLNHYSKIVHPNNGTMVLTGDVDVEKWCDRLNEVFNSRKGQQKIETDFEVDPIKEKLTIYKESEKEQSHIIFGYQALNLKDPRRYAMQIIQSVLAGQGGRLFMELRDKASLAYSVSPMRLEGLETGYFGAYIGCSPDKGKTAIQMIETEFNKLKEEQLSVQELDRAKRFLIGRHDIDLQKNSSIASAILFNEIYGVSGEEIYEYADRIKSVEASDVLDLAQDVFSKNPVISAIGSQSPF